MPEDEKISFEDKLTDENKQQIEEQISGLGYQLHDEWKNNFHSQNPDQPDRFKATKDEEWASNIMNDDLVTESQVTLNRGSEKETTVDARVSKDGRIAQTARKLDKHQCAPTKSTTTM